MEIGPAIKTAHEAVDEASLPNELRPVAFAEVLRHLLGGITQPAVQNPERPGRQGPKAQESGLARLAAKARVSEVALADLFEIDGDRLSLHVTSSRVASAKSRATRDIALLIVAARQGSGVDDGWTAVGHVRESLQQYGRYDTSNFSAYLHGVANAFNFRGKGISMELRLTQPGWEMALAQIRSLAGENA